MGLMEQDVVCGMSVDPKRAPANAEHAGKTYYFCCASCAAKFRVDPEKYLHAKPTVPGHASPLIQLGAAKPVMIAIPAAAPPKSPVYVCPMDPEVRQDRPGPCPKCGMSLEPDLPSTHATRIEYTCPMHPEIVRDQPGSCPICGMALEPRTAVVEELENPELVSMTRRFWISVALAIPVLVLGMSDLIPGQPVQRLLSVRAVEWIQLLLATPVVIWGGWPFFQRGWASLVNRSLNMFTLIALGTGTAYVYSVIAVLFPGIFPASFRLAGGAGSRIF